MTKPITGVNLGNAIAEALGLNMKLITSIKIECTAGDMAKVEITRFIDSSEVDSLTQKLGLTQVTEQYQLEEKEEGFVDYR